MPPCGTVAAMSEGRNTMLGTDVLSEEGDQRARSGQVVRPQRLLRPVQRQRLRGDCGHGDPPTIYVPHA